MASRYKRAAHRPADLLPVEIDARALGVAVAFRVENLRKNKYKFTLGDRIMTAAVDAGAWIERGVRTLPGKEKGDCFREADNALYRLLYCLEVANSLIAISDADKAQLDYLWDKVSEQVHTLLNSRHCKEIAGQSLSTNSVDREKSDEEGALPSFTVKTGL